MKTSPLVLIAGAAGVVYLLTRGRHQPIGSPPPVIAVPTPTPFPTPIPAPSPTPVPLPGGGVTWMPVALGARVVAVSPGPEHERHFGEHLNVAVIWAPETGEARGKMLPWDYRVYIGIGRPESPWFGRQFQQEGPKIAVEYRSLLGGEPVVTVQPFFLTPEFGFTMGKKDIMVSVVAAVNPQDPAQGKDVSGVWPNVAASEWREVAAFLKQDAIEILEGAPVTVYDGGGVANQECGCAPRYFSLRPS